MGVGRRGTGTLNTLTTKIQFTMVSIGEDGQSEIFHKPWFATLNMLFGMGLVGICDFVARKCSSKGNLVTPLMIDGPPSPGSEASAAATYRKKVLLVLVPAIFDILATALCAIGM